MGAVLGGFSPKEVGRWQGEAKGGWFFFFLNIFFEFLQNERKNSEKEI